MEINLHNYEAFFLDYKEGSLSQEQEQELFLFLEKYPHLYEELHGFENISLDDFAVTENFANKSAIKKTDYNEETLIAYAEDLLDEKNKQEIDLLTVQNVALKKELALYQAAKIQPDLSEKFKNKSVLKRGGVVIALQNNYTFLRVAAAILLLIGFFLLVNKFNSKDEVNNKVEIAKVNDESNSKRQPTVVNEPNIKQVASSNPEKEDQINKDQSQVIHKQVAMNSNENHEIKNKNSLVSPIQTNTLIANNTIKSNQKDSLPEKVLIAENKVKEESPVIDKSYFNYSADKEDENEVPVTASVNTGKKSFFQKIVKVAKKVNGLGLKNIDATEQNNSNSLSIGSFVVAETKSY